MHYIVLAIMLFVKVSIYIKVEKFTNNHLAIRRLYQKCLGSVRLIVKVLEY